MYTIHIFHTLTYKNNLHKDVYEFFNEIEHAVFHDLNELKEFISNKIEHLNVEHKRCKPIKITFDEVDRSKNIYMFGLSAIGTIQILKLRDYRTLKINAER